MENVTGAMKKVMNAPASSQNAGERSASRMVKPAASGVVARSSSSVIPSTRSPRLAGRSWISSSANSPLTSSSSSALVTITADQSQRSSIIESGSTPMPAAPKPMVSTPSAIWRRALNQRVTSQL